MGLADTYQLIAETLHQTASTYTTQSGNLQADATSLAGIVQNLVTGLDSWTGTSSYAFQGSFSKVQGDNKNIVAALSQASTCMTSLAQTIDDNLPAIRTYESYLQSASTLSMMPPTGAAQFRQELQLAEQASTVADLAIAAAVSSMSSQLDAASNEVGVCSTGNGQDNGINFANAGQNKKPGLLSPVAGRFNSLPKFLQWLVTTASVGGANSASAFVATSFLPNGLGPATAILLGNVVGGMSAPFIVSLINFLGVNSEESPRFFPIVQALLGGAIGTATAAALHFISPPASGSPQKQPQPQPQQPQPPQPLPPR